MNNETTVNTRDFSMVAYPKARQINTASVNHNASVSLSEEEGRVCLSGKGKSEPPSLNPCTVELYPKQKRLVTDIRMAFAKGAKRPCVQAATGFGKAIVLGYICRNAIEKMQKSGRNERVVISVDSLTLVDQLINTLEGMFGLTVGVIQGWNERFNLDAQVQIATPQTLTRRFASEHYGRLYQQYPVAMLLVDESHVQHRGIKEAAEYWDCKVIGFTATPYAKGMGLFYDALVKADTLDTLMEDGDLASYRAFSHATPDFADCKTSINGDIQADDKYDDGLIGDVVKTWKSKWSDRLTIGFATKIAKAEAFAKLFRENGVSSIAVHSKLSKEDAEQIIADFKSGKIRVLWSVASLIKGFDVPECSCMIDCQPTRSLMRHVQKGGRVLRKHPGKEYAVILDHAGNIQRNGLFEDASIDKLSMGKKNEKNPDRVEKEPQLIECPNCKVQMKPTKVCKNCGHEMQEYSKRDNPDEIGWQDGELVEFTNKAAGKRNRQASWEEKQQFIGGLRWVAANKHYKDGWVNHKYKEQFGVWPNDPRVKNQPAVPPSAKVNDFLVNSRKAYFAKANAKRKAVAA